jgi:hypothetical protein
MRPLALRPRLTPGLPFSFGKLIGKARSNVIDTNRDRTNVVCGAFAIAEPD